MPVITRSRTLPAAPERLWTAVADPSSSCRTGGPACSGWRRPRATPGPRCWARRKGRTLRADYTLLESDHPRRLSLAPRGRRVALRAHPQLLGHRAGARARRRGPDHGEPDHAAGAARAVHARRPPGGPRHAQAARRRAGRPRRGWQRAGGAAADALVGLGRGRSRGRPAGGGGGAAGGGAGRRRPTPAPRGWTWRTWPWPSPRCPRRHGGPWRTRWARTACATTARRGWSTPLGKSYPDLVRIRSGDGSSAPDAVVLPGSAAQVAAVLSACAQAGVAVMPFGGGTSVVGGVEPLRGGHGAAISLDLTRHGPPDRRRPRHRSRRRSSRASSGPELERRLGDAGLTLGHFPQSFEFSTVGRLGGHPLRRPGLDRLRAHRRAGGGRARARRRPARWPPGTCPPPRPGPSLRELVVGSEGTLGRDHRRHAAGASRAARRATTRAGRSAASQEGTEALRTLEQGGALAGRGPALRRGRDAPVDGPVRQRQRGRARRAGPTCALRGHEGGCLAFTGFEGTPDDVSRRRGRAAEMLRAAGGVSLGQRPGRAWLRGRFAAPYLRDELLDRGVMVETLETATTWSGLHGALRGRRRGAARRAERARHAARRDVPRLAPLSRRAPRSTSPSSPARRRGAELEQWRAAKTAACDAIAANGGTITHHHAVGRDHAPWMDGRGGRAGPGRAARGQGAAGPRRDHEPGQAAAGLGPLRRGRLGRGLRRLRRGALALLAPGPGSAACGAWMRLMRSRSTEVPECSRLLVDLLARDVDEAVAARSSRGSGPRALEARPGGRSPGRRATRASLREL